MKKALFIACAGILLLSFYSCTKNKTTNGNYLIGKWKLVQEGTDDNGNGIWDANERYNDTDGIYYQFLANGTGKFTQLTETPTDSIFIWTLTNNNTTLNWTYSGSQDITTHIDDLNATSMVLKYSSTPGLTQWVAFIKQ